MTLTFPEYKPQIKTVDQKPQIWCLVRKKWVAFTKEEWVRQNWLNYLIHVQQYPAALMSVEKEIHLGELKKRVDILVYKNSAPWILIECKEQDIPLSEHTIQQILAYQTVLQTGILIVSNGNDTRAFEITGTHIQQITQLPKYQ